MTAIGIESLSFATSRYFLDLDLLAQARGVETSKFSQGIGQRLMAVAPPDEDIVSLAASSAKKAIENCDDPQNIAMVLMATESGVDQSKACGIWVHHLLNLPSQCRVVELKQACYSGCAALQLALSYLSRHQNKKVLLIASDIARYGLHTAGEPTQGCAAASMILSCQPRLVAIEPEYGAYTSHVMDFWRPNYRDEAIVDGKYSTKVYLEALAESWKAYQAASGRSFTDHARFCYHIPFTRMAQKAHERLAKICGIQAISTEQIADSLLYSQQLGNSYTASLFVGLASLLENSTCDLTGQRIGFFSYGSGCVAEFFSGVVLPGYQQFLHTTHHQQLLKSRQPLSVDQYEEFYKFRLPQDGSRYMVERYRTGDFRLAGIDGHERLYESVI